MTCGSLSFFFAASSNNCRSGTLDKIRAIAETGVHRISSGSLTKDVKAVDFSMRFEA